MELSLREQADRVKAATTVREVAGWFGYDYPGSDNYPCPRCEGVSSSRRTLRVYDDHHWHCFHCDLGGDEIDWLAGKLGVTKGGAIRALAARLGIDADGGDLADVVRHALFADAARNLKAESVGDAEAREVLRCNRFDNRTDAYRARGWVACLRMARATNPEHRARAVSLARAAATGGPFPAVSVTAGHLALANEAIRMRDVLARDRGEYRRTAERRGWLTEDAEPFGIGAMTVAGSYWSGRIVFPIRDFANRTVGFGGRLVDPKIAAHPTAKYLNPPDRGVYAKSRELYGLDLALPSILATGFAVVVEGYADVVAAHADDVPNCVAPCGGSLSAAHAEVLSLLCREVVAVGDGDDAGRKAAARWASVARGARMDAVRVRLPDGSDPDDMVRARPGSLRAAVQAARAPKDPLAGVSRLLPPPGV